MEIEATVEIQLECKRHGNILDGSPQYSRGIWRVEVEPCSDCIADAKDEERNG